MLLRGLGRAALRGPPAVRWCSTAADSQALGQRLLTEDAFKVLGVARGFVVAEKDVRGAYRDLQMKFHPDRVTGESDEVKDLFLEVSAKCNTSYDELLDPYRRGCLLLCLETGSDIHDEERALELMEKLDEAFLEEVMEMKMAIADADDADQLKAFRSKAEKIYQVYIDQLQAAFASAAYESAELLLLKANYYRKMLEELKDLLPPE